MNAVVSTATRQFKFAVNPHGKDKDWNFETLATQYQDQQGTIQDVIRHVQQGHALCAGLLGGERRSKANVIGSEWLLLDIDNSTTVKDKNGKPVLGADGKATKVYSHQLTLDEAIAHPFVRQYCSLIYTTANHRTDWHKFRLVFLLPQCIQGSEAVEAMVRLLMEHFPHDPACKDASRVFYGNTKAEFPLVNPNACLPGDWLNQAIAVANEEKAMKQAHLAELAARREQFRQLVNDEGWNTDELIEQALTFIPPRQPGAGNYDECRQVLMALVDYYGPAEGQLIAERWSPSIPGNTWNIAQKVRSFRRSGITIGTLFKIAQEHGFRFPERKQSVKSKDVFSPAALGEGHAVEDEKTAFGNFCQRALSTLYTLQDPDKPWVCVGGQFYQWQGTHYELSPDEVEYRRVFEYADNFQTINKKTGLPEYPFASPHHVEQAIKWIKMGLVVDPRKVNPSGLNCTNGILRITWQGDRPSVELVPHSPEFVFTYAPVAKYDPDANSEACDRMLAALEPGQQDVFLKVAAASLDLTTVRKFRGRLIRALLMKGDGSNGKDTLRECLSAIYGYQSVTGCTLSDFEAYDQGRKFSLARMKDSRVNWASENGNAARLDKIQSLKAFITGDTLDCERKGVDVEEFTPQGIAIFNINDIPHLEAFQEAIKSRYAVVSFDKTFKVGADTSKGEIEADPRFKYDHEFLKSEVLPAFLNKLVDALQRLMIEGIDYSCTESALNEIQRNSSHLFQFAEDVGLTYGDGSDRLYAKEIWDKLESWYIANGTLTIDDKGKKIWTDQSRASDRNVKAPNQVVPRILQLFPKGKRGTAPDPKGVYITGLKFEQLIQFEAMPDPVNQTEKQFEAVDPISAIAAQVEEILEGLTEDQRQMLLSQLGVGQIGSTAQNVHQESDTGSGVGSELDHEPPPDSAETEAIAATSPMSETAVSLGDRVSTPQGEGVVVEIDSGDASCRVEGRLFYSWFALREVSRVSNVRDGSEKGFLPTS